MQIAQALTFPSVGRYGVRAIVSEVQQSRPAGEADGKQFW